jgi:predicted transcriptional regulator
VYGRFMAKNQVVVLPEALRAFRKVADVTQYQLSKEADCSDTLIALIETGRRQPRHPQLLDPLPRRVKPARA